MFSRYSLTYGFNALGGSLVGAAAASVGAPLAIGLSGGLLLAYTARLFKPMSALRPAPQPLPAKEAQP